MMNILIVYAHPEPTSFNAAMRDTAVSTLTREGHAVEVVELYADGFRPLAGRDDVQGELSENGFNLGKAQRHAFEQGLLADEIQEQQRKILWSDLLILQFPLWWFSMPAILKGWVDRILTTGFAYGGGRWYNHGSLKGRRALLSLTTGGLQSFYAEDGINGPIETVLHPIQHGILHFVGFEVLPPFIAWSVDRQDDASRRAILSDYRAYLATLGEQAPLTFPGLEEFEPPEMRRRQRPSLAGERVSNNDVAGLVYKVFADLDRLDDLSGFYSHLEEGKFVINFPDHSFRRHSEFDAYAAEVRATYEKHRHDVSNLIVRRERPGWYRAAFDVKWTAERRTGGMHVRHVHETWLIEATASGELQIRSYDVTPARLSAAPIDEVTEL